MNIAATISSLIILIGIFLPWMEMNGIASMSGLNTPDGKFILIQTIISGSLAVYNQVKQRKKYTWIFLVIGVIIAISIIFDYRMILSKREDTVNSMHSLLKIFNEDNIGSISVSVGSGLYVVALGSLGLILCGLGVFKYTPPLEKKSGNM